MTNGDNTLLSMYFIIGQFTNFKKCNKSIPELILLTLYYIFKIVCIIYFYKI